MYKGARIELAFWALIVLLIAFTLILDGRNNFSSIAAITGAPTGVAQVYVMQAAEITLVTASVNFGNVTPGQSKNTTTNDPLPLLIRNDGTVLVNVSIARDASSAPLFNGTGGGDNSSSFRYKPAVAGEGVSVDPSCSLLTWKNVPGTSSEVFLCKFNFNDTNDEAEVELLITPPSDESPGQKTETLVFTATQS